LQDGVLTAKIETPEDTYHIEPSWRHLGTNDTQTMIAYRESDILFSWNQPDEETDFVPPKASRGGGGPVVAWL
jgi:disintegrin and metalloproteinase domain-containing protein 17